MSLVSIISAYLVPFAGLLFLLVLIKINPLFDKKQTTLFMLAVVINLVLIVTTSLDYVFAELNYPYFWALRRVTSFLNFAASPFVPLLLLRIFNRKKSTFLLYLPCLINLVLCFISIFVKVVFFITTRNKYGRGPLFFVPFLITIIYMFLLIAKPNNYHMQSKKNERIFLFSIILLLMTSMFFEMKLGYRFLNWGCAALSLILYYLLLNIHCFILDPLTGVYNRLMYNRALDAVDQKSSCVMALIDINNFKQVNDTLGHDAGDHFLIRFVNLMNQSMDKIAVLYRIGGDEFVLISKKADYAAFGKALDIAWKKLGEQEISFAYGIVSYAPQQNLQDVLKEMDQEMYCHKSKMKETGTLV